MLKSAHGEECLWRTSVFEWHESSKAAQKVRMQKWRVKIMLTEFFDAEGIIHDKSVPEKQTVNGEFYKEVIRRLIAGVHRVGPEFQESGSWYLLHENAPAHSSVFSSRVLGETRDPRVIPSTLLP
jgi:hypothetical protein